MLGLLLLLVLKVCSSNAVQTTVGSTITLTCTASGWVYQWQRLLDTYWSSSFQNSSKYGNVNTAFLNIYNIAIDDAGTYRCTASGLNGSQQLHINLTVTYTVGTWSQWSQWNTCSKTCGVGTSTRNRGCTSATCGTSGFERMNCTTTPCPVNGRWSEWGAWSTCSTTCGRGSWTRYRSCDNPTPASGGSHCLGINSEMTQCYKPTCPAIVNGNWGGWGAWNSCPTTCGDGILTRLRSCDKPAPANGGSHCEGNDTESTPCLTTPCPVHGNWSAWQDWNSCSATCGSGSRSRYQECNNPEPANGGSECQGNNTEIESCSTKLCPVASEEDNSSAAVGIGAGIGSAAVIIGLLIVFVYSLKRYRLGKPAESAIYTTAGDTESSNSDLHIYNGLQQNTESPTHRQTYDIYINTSI